ncbi:hypothetical protein ACEPPN_009792 [Leptodophora sp. 'Broadleaf-Isolate-01']
METGRGALNITFQGDRFASSSSSSALVFNKRTELLKFQDAITGYQVVRESLDIKVITYAAAKCCQCTIGLILEPPRPSVLVLLLQKVTKRGDVSYSTIAVETDEATIIDPSSCKCHKDPHKCLRVVIQRSGSGSALTSIRQDAGTDLEAWNLAAFGAAQRKVLEKEQNGGRTGGAKERLAWTAVDFSGIEEKMAFEKAFESVKVLLARERASYNRTMTSLRN